MRWSIRPSARPVGVLRIRYVVVKPSDSGDGAPLLRHHLGLRPAPRWQHREDTCQCPRDCISQGHRVCHKARGSAFRGSLQAHFTLPSVPKQGQADCAKLQADFAASLDSTDLSSSARSLSMAASAAGLSLDSGRLRIALLERFSAHMSTLACDWSCGGGAHSRANGENPMHTASLP